MARELVDGGTLEVDDARHPIQDVARIVRREGAWYVLLNSGQALRVNHCPRCGTHLS